MHKISDEMISEAVSMRDKALRAVLENDDLSLMKKYIEQYCPEVKTCLIDWNSESPENIPVVLRLMAYKMIPEVTTFTPEERNRAKRWLRDHGSSPIFDREEKE